MAKLQPQFNSPLAYDPATNLYWYTNLPLLVGNYGKQSEIISTLDIDGFTNFRFATKNEVTSLTLTYAADAFTFVPTSYPNRDNSPNGPGFYWNARCADVESATPGRDTYRSVVEFYCDPLQSYDVRMRTRAVGDTSDVVEAPDLGVSAWVVCVKRHHPHDPHVPHKPHF